MQIGSIGLFARAIAFSAATVLAACAHKGGTEPANPFDSVKTISIDPLIVMPPSVHYLTTEQAVDMALNHGVVSFWDKPSDSIRAKLETNHIDMGEIVIEEMRNVLAKQQRFRVVEENADATLSFKVTDYGFHAGSLLSSDMNALLAVDIELTDTMGHVLFKHDQRAESQKDTRHSMDEYFEDPSRIRAAFHQVAATIAAGEIDSFLWEASGG